MEQDIKYFTRIVKKDPDFNSVKAIFLYGSKSKNKSTPISDIDICLVTKLNKRARFKLRKRLLGNLKDNFDVQIFEDLPLVIKKEVLSGGLIYCIDKDFILNLAYKIKNLFDDFYRRYLYYITHTGYKNVPKTHL